MAIDPKELRIGSHVFYIDVRVRVVDINQDVLYFRGISKVDNKLKNLGTYPTDENINPIPITEELLSELGFRKKMFDSDWSMWTKDFDSFSISVGIQNSECKGFEIKDNDDKDAMWGWSYPCKYLHEMESFYYHCTKQELIND